MLRDRGREPRVTVAVDDHVAGRHDREAARAPESEPRSRVVAPRAPVAVARGLDRLVPDRDAHERHVRGLGRRGACGEPRREIRGVEPGDDHAVADRERRDVEVARDHGRAVIPVQRDGEGLVGELAVELAQRGAGGVRARDRIGDRVLGRRAANADEGIGAGLGVGDQVARARARTFGDRGAPGDQPPSRVEVEVGDRGELVVELACPADPAHTSSMM